MNYLARREHSRQELLRKLRPHVGEDDDLPALLDDFEKRGWLSDQRFAEQLVHARKSRYGSQKIAHELREKGVSEALAEQAVATIADQELAHAREVWQKKFGELPADREAWARQARFLQSRGFGFDVIKQVLRGAPDQME